MWKIKSPSEKSTTSFDVASVGQSHAVQGSKGSRSLVNAPYQQAIDTIASELSTSTESGLSDDEAARRLAANGPNNLGDDSKISITKIFAHQVFNAMVLVLIISMIIALAIRDWISGGVIGGVVALNVFVGFIQEFKAEKTMGSLKLLLSAGARVLRSGSEQNIDADNVVAGDIVFISVGDTVPADLRLYDVLNLETDEALLTGESLPVSKDSSVVYDEDIPVGDRLNMAYSSSVVTKGRGWGIAVATGLGTEIGKIADELKTDENPLVVKPSDKVSFPKAVGKTVLNVIMNVLGTNVGTPLQRKLSWLAIILFWVAVVFAIVVMASQKMDVTRSVAIYAICVALSMIPSSLVVVLTITMAIGAQVMVTKNVIVRKLDSLEALGGINDICSDKTGTLTMGKMIVRKVWVPSVGTYQVTDLNEPFNPEVGELGFASSSPQEIASSDEEVDFTPDMPETPDLFEKWLKTATLANIATVTKTDEGWEANGDATEIAINVFTTRLGYTRGKYEELDHVSEFPFDSSIKRMSTIYRDPNSNESWVYTKGAVERVLDLCKRWYVNGELVELDSDAKTVIEENMAALSAQGLRVLAFAQREIKIKVEDANNRDDVESNLSFLGLVGIYDPPRPETRGSVKACHTAGINVRMLTGDHPGTARAIAQEVGILPHNLYHYSPEVVKVMVMTAAEFDALSDEEVDALPVLPLVIARCAPQTKVRMIDALHRRNKFVAMTGDGVNDSPSLKKADVGIAMGMNGSDVAKDASDIILTDDNFALILNAIEEGRRMSSNIQKFVLQLLAENVAQAIYLMVGLSFFDTDGYSVFPLAPVECLWIIVVTSCFPAMGLGQEQASDDILQLPPNKSIFTREVIVDMFAYGFWMACCCITLFSIVVFGKGDGYLGHQCNTDKGEGCDLVFQGRSGAFAAFTWCALLLAWECIHLRNSFFNMRPDSELPWWRVLVSDLWANQFLFWSVIFGFVTVFPVVYIPVINDIVFLHGPIGYEWGLSIAFTIAFLAGCEVWKCIKRVYYHRKRAKNPEYELERNDPFQRYASFSKANTMDV